MNTTAPATIDLRCALNSGQPWPGAREAVAAELGRADLAGRSDHLATLVDQITHVNREWKLEDSLRALKVAAIREGVRIVTTAEEASQ
jgi:hypothetical protein